MSTINHHQRLKEGGLSSLLFFCALLSACGQATPRIAPGGTPLPAVKTGPTLLGRWQSTTDPLSEIEVTPALYTEKYQGKPVAVSTYKVSIDCGCAQRKQLVYKPPALLTTCNQQEGDCHCYLIEQLTPTTLRLANYGQGGFFTFRRIK